jgi:hypothetical protein
MANYFNAGISEVSFLADEDLSEWQWKLVMAASTSGYVQKYDILPTAGSPRFPLGVVTNSPSLGQEATVKVIGFTKAYATVATCYLSHGALLSCSNSGNFVPASQDASDHIAGMWFGPDATSGNAYGNVLLNPFPASGTQILGSVN